MDETGADEVVYREEVKYSDLAEIRSVVHSTGFFSPEEEDIAVELVDERLNRGETSGYYFLVREQAGGVTGYTCYGPIAGTAASYDLYWIAVRDDFRGKGLGKDLMSRTEDLIRVQGGMRVYAETSSRGQYGPTRRFYGSCGYIAEAVIKDFYAPGDSKVIYVKELR